MLNNVDNLLYESQFMEVLYFSEKEILYNKWKVTNILQKDLYNEMMQWQKFFNAKFTNKIVTDNSVQQTLDKEQVIWLNKFLNGIFAGKEIYWDIIMPTHDLLLKKTIQKIFAQFGENIHWKFIDEFVKEDYL